VDAFRLQAGRLFGPLRKARPESTLEALVREAADGDPQSAQLAESFGFLLRLGRALLRFGLPAQRLEDALTRLAESLGLHADCFATPTALIVTLSDGLRRRTRVVRVEPGETDLERLSALHSLVGRVERRELSPSDASRRLDRILARPERYSGTVLVMCHGLAAAAASVLLGGRLIDIGPAAALGLFVGALTRLSPHAPNVGRILPAIAAALCTFAAGAFGLALPVRPAILVLSAVIVLLPGFTLTVATLELATANVVSGTSRLVGAFATLVQLGFGVALGHQLAASLPDALSGPAAPSPEWLLWIAYGMAALAFTVLLRAAPRDLPAILLAAFVSVAGARLGKLWLGPELSALIAAIVIGLWSHVWARRFDKPTLLLLTPGILMLVPGSVGFLSVSSMLEADITGALQTAFRMLLIATSLAAGVLIATVAVPPRRAL